MVSVILRNNGWSNSTKYNEIWTASNLTGRTSNSLEPRLVYQNRTSKSHEPLQKTKLWTCSTRNGLNPGPNLQKPKFEPFHTQVRLLKSNYEPTRTLYKSRTSNPQTGFDPTLILNCTLISIIFAIRIARGI